jgi:GINS complex subunit 2
MSGLTLKTLVSAENEFLAEETLVRIVSGTDHPALNFISGRFGPLLAGFPAEVPLWLAITLRKRGKCTIAIPEWMSIISLEQYIANERSQVIFAPLPYYYREISQLLLTHAREEIQSPDRVAVLLQDLENIRMDRSRLGILDMADKVRTSEAVVYAGLPNVGAIEVQTIRRFSVESISMFSRLTPGAVAVEQQPYSSYTDTSVADDGYAGEEQQQPRSFRRKNKKN